MTGKDVADIERISLIRVDGAFLYYPIEDVGELTIATKGNGYINKTRVYVLEEGNRTRRFNSSSLLWVPWRGTSPPFREIDGVMPRSVCTVLEFSHEREI